MLKAHLIGLVLIGCLLSNVSFSQTREIAITIDDLPFVGTTGNKPGNLRREHDRFMRILQALIDERVPATGFVIGGTIEKNQWELLEQFHDAGFKIGNHTYSHRALSRTSAEKYIQEIDHTDNVLAPLMSGTKYFRYPYLDEGKGEKKKAVHEHLANQQYIIAPVTIDSKDYRFNERLFRISWRVRKKYINQIKRQYLNYIWKQTLRAEKKVPEGQPIKQILLIHANLLNSYCLQDIIQMYKDKGYRFVSLDEVMKRESTIAPISTTTSPDDSTSEESPELNNE